MADASVHATIEVDPVRTLLVLGPQVTALCLSEIKNTFTAPSFLSYKNIVEIGIGKALELDEFSTSEAKSRRQLLLQNAYELEPAFAAHKIVETLKYNDSYDAWIKEVFLSTKEMQFNADASRTLQHLLHMRRKGVRLVYTHYDDLLARALGLPVVLLEDEEDVRKWSQGFPALLHLHGVFSRPQSMKLDCLCYQSMVGGGKVADIIREQFQSRSVIFIGYDDQFMDPFLPKILTSFATPHTMPTSLPLLVSMQKKCPINNGALPILVESKTSISSIVKISTTPLGVAPINDSSHPVSLQLVCNTRQGALEVFEILQHCPNILGQVLQDGSDKYILDLQMSRPVLQKIWTQLFAPGIASKLQGLAAIELQGSFVIRLNQQQLMAEGNAVSPTPVLTSTTLLPSLSSSATSAASIWKHLVTTSMPSVSTLPHFTIPSGILQAKLDAQKQLQLVNQAALASKLVNQAAVGTNQMPLNQMHHEKVVRRIQSENALENRLEKPEPRKNGILVHQQSAPTFGNTGYLMSPNKIVNPAYPVPSPSVLMNMDRKLREHKIEFVEQQSLSEDGSKTTEVDQGGLKNHVSFEDKKLKFIKEAQEWSRQVGSRIGKKSISEEDDVEITDSKFLVTSTPSYPVSTPLIPINAAGNIVSLPIQSPNATPSSPHSANLSPKLSVPKQPPAFLLSSPQSCSNIFTLLPPTSAIPSMAGPILGPSLSQLPLLSSMPGKPATSNAPSFIPGVLPGSFPLTTPSDQKFIYLMQDGQIVAAPYPQENNTLVKLYDKAEADSSRTTRSPKRTDSPNSDQEYRPSKKRRRSSSLPDVNLLKSPSTDSPASPSSPSPVLPISSSASTGPIPDSSYVSLMSNNLTTPSVFFPSIQLPQTTLIKMEHQNGEPENGHDGHVGNNYPPSPAEDNKLHPVPPGRGPIQLWQFLLDLLLSSDNSHLIQWTGNGYEFHIIQPEEIAKLWGARKNKPRMNYDKLSRGLRYYYSKGIMDKVPGKKLTFKYTCDIQQYIVQRSNLTTPPGPSPSIAKSL